MKLPEWLRGNDGRAGRIIALLACIGLLAAAGNKLYSPDRKTLTIYVNGNAVYTQPVGENVSLLVEDSTVRALAPGESVNLQDSAHQINVFELEGGFLRCAASNCEDQQCVYAGEINAAGDNDMIVCEPHQVIASVK